MRILVRNYGHADYIVKPGEAVAQMVLEKVSVARIKEVKGFDGPIKKPKDEVGPLVRSLIVEKAAALSGTSTVEWLQPEVKGFGKVGKRLRPWKATPTGGGGDDPPEPIERAWGMSLGRMSGRSSSWRTRSGCRAFIWWRDTGTTFQDGEIYL